MLNQIMKNELYVGTIARAYRLALDALSESEEAYRRLLPWCEEEVLKSVPFHS